MQKRIKCDEETTRKTFKKLGGRLPEQGAGEHASEKGVSDETCAPRAACMCSYKFSV